MSAQFDCIVVGGGPGGYGAALYAASAGLNVALVERDKIGGTCLHRGCIPAKELLETAHVYRTVNEAKVFGVQAEASGIDVATMMGRKQQVIDGLAKGVTGLLKGRKVTVYNGTGTLGAGRAVTVTAADGSSETITADAVILAPGSVPRTIPGFEVDGKTVMTSDEVFEMTELPSSAVVIGGGAIGCEFASVLSDLGAKVTILEALPQILPGCDRDAVQVVLRSFKKRGIDVITGTKVTGNTVADGSITVNYGEADSLTVDTVIVSVGRRPFNDLLGLEGTAVEVSDRGFIEVDEYCRTGEDGVFAIGDAIATPGLAHVGFAEAVLVVKQIMGDDDIIPVDYGNVPWCIYCFPEVAFAGLTEEAAKEAGFDVIVSKHRYAGNSRALIIGESEGLVKIVAEKLPDGTGGRILGVHLAGPWATEQLGQGYLAVNWEATAAEVGHFIQPHPTLSELFGESVLALTGRSLHG